MTPRFVNERGAAMVLALGVLVVLAVLAMVVVAIVVSEKQAALSDYSSDRSFYSADAATEAGVNWVRQKTSPPPIIDGLGNVFVATGFTALSNDHNYKFNIGFVRKQPRPGWSVEYKDYVFDVQATGTSVQGSVSTLDVNATRLYREGY